MCVTCWRGEPTSPYLDGMTMSSGEIESKVGQLDHDVQSVYELLASISGQQGRHLNRLGALDAKIDGVEERLTARIDGLATSMTEVLRRLPG